ncbi:MAG: Spermidine/putrescine transport system permease protein PotB [Verrucomicrobiota bacterium]|jgi:spermidine/putrescine transport system permease protein
MTHGSKTRTATGHLALLLFAPLVLWLIAFVVVPAGILVVYSFAERDELGRIVYAFSWENYRRVCDPVYARIFGRSAAYAALTTIICAILGYPVAWFIARASLKWRRLLLFLVMIPFWTSFLIRTYAWIVILKSDGVLNAFLLSAGLIAIPLEVLYTPFAVMVGLVYAYLPFMILPLYGSAEKLDPALLEAAHDLGCGPWRSFVAIVLPLTRPGLLAGVLMVFVPAIGMFAITDLMGGARVPMIGNVIQDQFVGQARDKPFGAALGVVFLLLFAGVYGWLQRRSKRSAEARP